MYNREADRSCTERSVLARYWQNLSQPLHLPESPPARADLQIPSAVPLEQPISLSLKRLVDAEQVSEAPETLQNYAGGRTYAGYLRQQVPGSAPSAVVSPRNEQELAAILMWATQRDIKVLPWGQGTRPYYGKNTLGTPFIVLTLASVNRTLDFDPQGRIIKMQAGATWQDIELIAEKHGLTAGKTFLHSPSTLGGSLSLYPTYAHSPRYGTLADDVVALRLITPSGPLDIRGTSSETAALLGFVLGERGRVGIITEVTFQLHRQPEENLRLSANFPTRELAISALREIAHHHRYILTARLVTANTVSFLGNQRSGPRNFSPRTLFNGSNNRKDRLFIELVGPQDAVARTRRSIEGILRRHQTSIEGNGHGGHVKDGLWSHYQPLWRELWRRQVMTHRLTTLVPWPVLAEFMVAWEDALSSVLLSTSGVPGLPLTTIHAKKRYALLDTLILGQQPAGDLFSKTQQLERMQAVATEVNWRWNIGHAPSFLADKTLETVRRTLEPSNVMLS